MVSEKSTTSQVAGRNRHHGNRDGGIFPICCRGIRENNCWGATRPRREAACEVEAERPDGYHTPLFEDMTSSEISEFIGVSENTIKSRLRRARQRLKKYEFMIQEALDITIEGKASLPQTFERRFWNEINF